MRKSNEYPNAPTAKAGSPQTAFDAAAEMADAAKSREAVALSFIRSQGLNGATADEVAAHFEWDRYSSRPRLSTIRARQQIVDSGERRKGESGRGQAVWIAAEFSQSPDDPQLPLSVAA